MFSNLNPEGEVVRHKKLPVVNNDRSPGKPMPGREEKKHYRMMFVWKSIITIEDQSFQQSPPEWSASDLENDPFPSLATQQSHSNRRCQARREHSGNPC